MRFASGRTEHDLPYFDDEVHFPDVRVEYQEPDGRWEREDIEVVTPHYRGAHGASVARSGFSCYRGLSLRIVDQRRRARRRRRPTAALAEDASRAMTATTSASGPSSTAASPSVRRASSCSSCGTPASASRGSTQASPASRMAAGKCNAFFDQLVRRGLRRARSGASTTARGSITSITSRCITLIGEGVEPLPPAGVAAGRRSSA